MREPPAHKKIRHSSIAKEDVLRAAHCLKRRFPEAGANAPSTLKADIE